MEWNSNIIKNLWPDNIQNRESKQKVAMQIATKAIDGDTIGIGSGSTSYLALLAIAQRIKIEKLKIKAVPTSIEIALTCVRLGIPVISLNESRPDWCFDGADEVDPNNHLIKGRGGAMFKEKLIMSASERNYILIDHSKKVDKLGAKFSVPIEVFPSSLMIVEAKLRKLGAYELILRPAQGKDGPVISESGNLILDVRFDDIDKEMEYKIKCITGVIESGLFQNLQAEVIVG